MIQKPVWRKLLIRTRIRNSLFIIERNSGKACETLSLNLHSRSDLHDLLREMPRKRRASTSSLEEYPSEEKYAKEDMDSRAPRNAANARERARMRVLSKAFCRLKTTLPWVPADTKLSKLDTLRLAATYIAHLRAVLRDDGEAHPETTKSLSLTLVSAYLCLFPNLNPVRIGTFPTLLTPSPKDSKINRDLTLSKIRRQQRLIFGDSSIITLTREN